MTNADKDTSVPRGAILQRDGKTYAIKPRTPLGVLPAETLKAMAEIVEEYDLPMVKVTAGQRLMLVGIKEEDLRPILHRLGPCGELCAHYVQACPGANVCRLGMRETLAFGTVLEELLVAMKDLPAKVKVGISGCSMCCSESHLRDIGLLGKKSGWTVIFGGNAGTRPRQGDVIGEKLSDGEAAALVLRALEHYKRHGKPKERTARFVERVGIESIREALA